MKYAHYDETNGKLLGWYDSEIHTTIPTPNIEVSDSDWQIAIDNNYNFVDTTTNTLSLKDFRTFSELQTAKINEIKQAYNTALSLGYTCSNGITMDAKLDSISSLKAGYDLVLAGNGTVMTIRDYNNQVHIDLPIADVFAILTELGTNYQTLLAKKWNLEEKVNLATTQAELDLIIW